MTLSTTFQGWGAGTSFKELLDTPKGQPLNICWGVYVASKTLQLAPPACRPGCQMSASRLLCKCPETQLFSRLGSCCQLLFFGRHNRQLCKGSTIRINWDWAFCVHRLRSSMRFTALSVCDTTHFPASNSCGVSFSPRLVTFGVMTPHGQNFQDIAQSQQT